MRTGDSWQWPENGWSKIMPNANVLLLLLCAFKETENLGPVSPLSNKRLSRQRQERSLWRTTSFSWWAAERKVISLCSPSFSRSKGDRRFWTKPWRCWQPTTRRCAALWVAEESWRICCFAWCMSFDERKRFTFFLFYFNHFSLNDDASPDGLFVCLFVRYFHFYAHFHLLQGRYFARNISWSFIDDFLLQ